MPFCGNEVQFCMYFHEHFAPLPIELINLILTVQSRGKMYQWRPQLPKNSDEQKGPRLFYLFMLHKLYMLNSPYSTMAKVCLRRTIFGWSIWLPLLGARGGWPLPPSLLCHCSTEVNFIDIKNMFCDVCNYDDVYNILCVECSVISFNNCECFFKSQFLLALDIYSLY